MAIIARSLCCTASYAAQIEANKHWEEAMQYKFSPIWYVKLRAFLVKFGLLRAGPLETLGMRPGKDVIREITQNKKLQSLFFYELAAIGKNHSQIITPCKHNAFRIRD